MIVGQKPAGQKHTKKIENRQKPTSEDEVNNEK